MRAMWNRVLVSTVVAGLCVVATASICAQAPTGPQGGAQPEQAPPTQQQPKAPAATPPPQSGVTISVENSIVTVDAVATTVHGDLLLGLKKENFKITDDGVPQTISGFSAGEAPITMVVVMEFSARSHGFFAQYAKYWADALFPNLQQKDWVALVTFDMQNRLEVDFTQDKNEVRNAIYHLYFPGFSESNVFDALLDTNTRLKDVKGKKSILLIASGIDTFSKHTLDQTMKQLRQSDVPIFCVGLGKVFINAGGARGATREIDYMQAENELKTFSAETGGFAWFPQFDGEIPGIFQQVASFLRHQYNLSYTPTNGIDGKFHKIKVELVAPDGGPLTVLDQKGKKQKTVVYARQGYQAPNGPGGSIN
jgi:VWFA-related protein